jgi:hypothetical protein
VDFLLLEKLPDKGMLGGIHWNGRRVKDLVDEINESLNNGLKVTSSFVQARLRAMHVAGYVSKHPGSSSQENGGGQNVWARTLAGQEFLKTKASVLSQ